MREDILTGRLIGGKLCRQEDGWDGSYVDSKMNRREAILTGR